MQTFISFTSIGSMYDRSCPPAKASFFEIAHIVLEFDEKIVGIFGLRKTPNPGVTNP